MTDELVSLLRNVATGKSTNYTAGALEGKAADELEARARRIAELERALEVAVDLVMKREPPDSRAVSDIAVALAAVSAQLDDSDGRIKQVIDAALSGTTPPADALVEDFELVLKRLCDANHKDEAHIRKVLSDALTAHKDGE